MGKVRARRNGYGSIHREGDYFTARIYLRDGRRVAARRYSLEDAEKALVEMIEIHRENLGALYYLNHVSDQTRPVQPRVRPPRAGVTRRVRWTVLERDGFRCVYCGATPDPSALVIDHILPVADGGSDEMTNLATACYDCNSGKGGRALTKVPDVVRRIQSGT